jgi:hypothetical protein
MWKNIVQPDRPQMTIRRMRIACWIPKATNTHSGCVILITFPLQQWLQERASLLRSTCTACLVVRCQASHRPLGSTQTAVELVWRLSGDGGKGKRPQYKSDRNLGGTKSWFQRSFEETNCYPSRGITKILNRSAPNRVKILRYHSSHLKPVAYRSLYEANNKRITRTSTSVTS